MPVSTLSMLEQTPTGGEETQVKYNYVNALESCKDYLDIFRLVKDVVRRNLGVERKGLNVIQSEMPLELGALHKVGTNLIVLNRRLLKAAGKWAPSKTELNSFIFYVMLHEYLHSLGYHDEMETRRLAYQLIKENFGPGHPASHYAKFGPWILFR
ncbi:MAG: hypothetical protein QXO32_01360 [Candidatus Bathyarchaeia archaeon]